MANDITMKVGVDTKDAEDGFKDVVEMASKSASDAQSKFSDIFKGSFAGGFAADFAGDIKNTLMQGVSAAVDAGNNFEKALQSVSAVTGVTGDGLDDLGTRAQDLALQFGGSATTQLEAFQTVLSKFGPDLAKTPEALGTVAESVNVLGKAAGLDAKQSVDALSNAMLQFGVDASDPAKLAQESGRFINVLAASAKVGAAEIPQVSEAILQAGVAAKGAGLSFEETNAAIQGLAVGGKVGSEAGVALRNVISKLIDGGGEQKKVLESVGLSYEKLGKTLTTSAEDGGGLASALELLKGGLDKITDPAAKAAAAGKLFGAENASAAGILLDQVDNIKLFTEGVTGTNEATVQAAINQDTLASRFEKVKAAIEVGLIKAFQALTPIVKFVFDNFATIATYLSPIAAGLAAVGVAAYVASPSFLAMSAGISTATASTIAWTAALLVNPVFLIAAAVVGAAIGIAALADAMSTSTEENLENAESQKKVIEEQMKLNKEQQQGEIQTQALVNEFQALAGKSELTAKEQKRLQEIQGELDKKYPKLIDQTKSYKENLDGVAKVGEATTSQLTKLKNENDNLEKAFAQTAKLIAYEKRNLAIQEFTGVAPIDTAKFVDLIYNAKNEDAVLNAQRAFLEKLNASGASNLGETTTALQKVVNSAIATFKKKAEEPIKPKVEIKDTTDKTDKDKKDKAKPPKQDDPRLQAIQDVITAENALQEKIQETAQAEADKLTGGVLTAEQQKKLYSDELERLKKILDAKGESIVYDNKQYKSIQEVGNISVTADGKVISGLKGKAGEIEKVREKAAKFYDDIDDKIKKLNTSLAKISATENKEVFKNTLDALKSTSEELRKNATEQLTVKYAFTVDEKVYSDSIAKLKLDFETANNELNAIKINGDEKQQAEIEKILKENLEKQKTIETEYANIVERIKVEKQTDADKRRLDLALLDLKIKFEKEQEENKGNFTKLAELETAYLLEREKLNEEYNRQSNVLYGIQSAIEMAMMEQFNIGRLMEERKANEEIRKAKLEAFEEEESDLEKSLADRTISFEEYQAKIAEIQQRRIDEGVDKEKLGEQLLQNVKIAGDKAISTILTDQGNKFAAAAQERANKQIALDAKVAEEKKALAALSAKEGTQEYIDAEKRLQKAQADAAKNDEDVYGFRTSVLEEFGGKAAIQFAQLAASGKANLADFGKAAVQLAFEALQKMIPIYVTKIAGEEFAKGIGGIATTAILTAALYGLFAAAQSAAGFKDGVVSLEGEGTETSDSIPAWLSKGESVITAKATKNNEEVLKWMNANPDKSVHEYWSINEHGKIVKEIEILKEQSEFRHYLLEKLQSRFNEVHQFIVEKFSNHKTSELQIINKTAKELQSYSSEFKSIDKVQINDIQKHYQVLNNSINKFESLKQMTNVNHLRNLPDSQIHYNDNSEMVHEIRQLKQVTENLGVQITRNTKVDVHGVLHADGNSLTAMIEANRKKNSRRF